MRLSSEQQRLVEDNLALVRKVIHDKVKGIGGIGIFTYEDIYQIGCIGLCKAAYTDRYQYAYNRGKTHSEEEMRFSTYAYRLIWNEIYSKLFYATKARAESATPQAEILARAATGHAFANVDMDDVEFRVTLLTAVQQAAKDASGVTAKGIQALLYMMQGYTSTEIGKMMGGVSCHYVTAWISKARKYLKQQRELQSLAEGVL